MRRHTIPMNAIKKLRSAKSRERAKQRREELAELNRCQKSMRDYIG